MDKYDYVTATIEEEKIRLEKLISYLKENNLTDILVPEEERYNNILIYLTAKDKYFQIEDTISEDKEKLANLTKTKDEYEVDNILLEDTLLSKFHEDTGNRYRNILYENIKYEEDNVKEILYLLLQKESNYIDLIDKRNKLLNILTKDKYPNTYNTLISQGIIIEKQNTIIDEIYLIENRIKIEVEKQEKIKKEIITEPILKILYEFWIIDSYNPNRVNKNKLFKDNRSLISIKNVIEETPSHPVVEEEIPSITGINLPGVNEQTLINIEGKKYIEK